MQRTGYGALFCTFNVDGLDFTECYFKDVRGNIYDAFNITSSVPDTPTHASEYSSAMPFLEFIVADGDDDFTVSSSGAKSLHDEVLSITPLSSVFVTFAQVDIPPKSVVHHAALQFFSAAAVDGESVMPDISIRATHKSQMAATVVSWTTESEDWEKHTVWNTNSIAALMNEIVTKPDWIQGDSITFVISINSPSTLPRRVYSIEHGKRYAPTLVAELQKA